MKNYEPLMNGVFHVMCKIMENIMVSGTEDELSVISICGQDNVPIRITLLEMNHTQQPTPIQVGKLNSCKNNQLHYQAALIKSNGHEVLLGYR